MGNLSLGKLYMSVAIVVSGFMSCFLTSLND